MKVKIVPNPDFDFTMGYIGGFDDVPTKQDKFKPVKYKYAVFEDENGDLFDIEDDMYVMNKKRKEGQKKFEENLISQIKENVKEHHPYKKPTKLEVVIGIHGSTKRNKKVDIDNLVKCILDCFNGLIYEDDSQIVCLIASKDELKSESIPELSGMMIGVRVLSEERKMLNNIPLYYMEELNEEE